MALPDVLTTNVFCSVKVYDVGYLYIFFQKSTYLYKYSVSLNPAGAYHLLDMTVDVVTSSHCVQIVNTYVRTNARTRYRPRSEGHQNGANRVAAIIIL